MPPLPGVENLKYNTNLDGPGAGAAVDVQLTSDDFASLSLASEELAALLRGYPSLIGIENTFSAGKQQLDYQILPEGRSLGLTSSDVARQLRSSFFGAEALREHVGRLERRTMVRLPEEERAVENDVADIRIRTPRGGFVPLEQVAERSRGQAPTSITREDGIRSINVRADLAPGVPSSRDVLADIQTSLFPMLQEKYPGLTLRFAGEQRDQQETMSSLGQNYLLALLAIYGLLAIPFKSYIQPFIIMSAIPFGFVGAVAGHMIMGFSLSVISMFGIVALTGVVVNDSLVLIDAANTYRANGESPMEAVMNGAKRRFRPILLTSLTTFLGLAPMILEKSLQARFLIPMAISLGFGVLFATGIILLIVPSLYMIVEDLKGLRRSQDAESKLQDKSTAVEMGQLSSEATASK
jgi:multidrug efflux pump subunit AcrB